ncbi:conjugal transfer protein TraH [Pseudomonadota bacterium]
MNKILRHTKNIMGFFNYSVQMASFILITALFINLLFVKTSHATDIGESMTEFWEDLGGTGNVNSAAAYNGQSAGYYTLGGIHTRSKSMTVNPINIQGPSLRAGCGGIDMYMGSFSFINKDQFIALGKSVTMNAVGYAFDLALAAVCPMCKNIMRTLQNTINQINNMAINSCEQAAALVGGAWPQSDEASKRVCSTLGAQRGFFSDAAAAKHGCSTGGQRASVNNSLSNSDPNQVVENTNYAWTAIMQSGYFGSGSSLNTELAELVMSMAGSIIVIAPANDNSSTPIVHLPSIIHKSENITSMLDGGAVEVYKCDETNKCLYPTKQVRTISQATAFNARAKKLITSMLDKVKSDTPLSEEEINFLNMTSIPLYKIVNVHSAYEGASDLLDVDTYAEMVALDILYEYMSDILFTIDRASKSVLKSEEQKLNDFKNNIQEVKANIRNKRTKNNQKFHDIMTIVERTAKIETLLSGNLSSQMKDSLNWAKGMEN